MDGADQFVSRAAGQDGQVAGPVPTWRPLLSRRADRWAEVGHAAHRHASFPEVAGDQIVECRDTTAHIADYLAGSLRLDELEELLTHAAACVACRDELTAAEERWGQLGRTSVIAPDLSAMRRRFNTVLSEYQNG